MVHAKALAGVRVALTCKDYIVADSFPDSARRHRSDASHLAASERFQNAGHLIGFAAECLAKNILTNAGITIDSNSPFRCHFPDLGRQIKIAPITRIGTVLAPILGPASFLDGWRAESRYEATLSPHDAKARYIRWQTDVDALFRAAGVP